MKKKTSTLSKAPATSKTPPVKQVRLIPGPFASTLGLLSVALVICVLHLGQLIATGYQQAAVTKQISAEIATSNNLRILANSNLLRTLPEGTGRQFEELGAIYGLVHDGNADRALETLRSKSFQQPALRAMVENKLAALVEKDRRIDEIHSQEKSIRGAQDRALKKFEFLRKEFATALGHDAPAPASQQAETAEEAAAPADAAIFARYDKGIFYGLPVLEGMPVVTTVAGVQEYLHGDNRRFISEQLTSSKSQLYRQLMLFKQRGDDLALEYEQGNSKAGGFDSEHDELIAAHEKLKSQVLNLTKVAANQVIKPKTSPWTAALYTEFREFAHDHGTELPELRVATPPPNEAA